MKKFLSAVLMSACVLGTAEAQAQSTEYYNCVNASNKQDDDYVKCYLEEAKRDVAKIDSYYQIMTVDPNYNMHERARVFVTVKCSDNYELDLFHHKRA